ncbi:type 2 lanthipeptide synthetase LanM [Paraburkholderia domus]|uniref:type 2 lanthipeptide synthetase LanM n=1 Tax=Paraburkholderia domus TaxID=2793075 RepID=UPI001B8C8461|nr:type 2 lanthipeptide synthetase LanM [Paraburkholderia domus]
MDEATTRFRDAAENTREARVADLAFLASGFRDNVERRLSPLLMPCLVLEANLARLTRSPDATSADGLSAFIERFRSREARDAFWSKYPVIHRLATATARNAAAAAVEAICRIGRDRDKLSDAFDIPESDALSDISWSGGDSHRQGRSVLILRFVDRRVVLKPRPMAIDVAYNGLLRWYVRRAAVADPERLVPASHQVLDMGDYGYAEFVPHRPAADNEAAARFYDRLGQIQCIAWILGITDLHHENLIADGENPHLVDVEAVGAKPVAEPRVRRTYQRSMTRAFRAFGFGTGLLPMRVKGEEGIVDMSAIGSLGPQTAPTRRPQIEGYGGDDARIVVKKAMMPAMQNAPVVEGKSVSPVRHLATLKNGFATARQVFMQGLDELEAPDGPLSAFGPCVTRLVARQTQDYADLIGKAAHPSIAVDAAECDAMWAGSLRGLAGDARNLDRLVRSETECLWAGDVPYFSVAIDSCDLIDSRGDLIPGFFEEDGTAGMYSRLMALDRMTLIHDAALDSAIRSTVPLSSGPSYASVPERLSIQPDVFVRVASAIGDSIVAHTAWVDGMPYGVGLIPLEVENYTAVVLPADLYDGLPGVGLFMGYLARQTGDSCHATFARGVRELVRRLIRERAGPTACGAFNGLAGLIYADLHLSRCLGLPSSDEAMHALPRLRRLAEVDPHLDIVSGASGALLVSLRMYEATGDAAALAAGAAAARRLAEKAERQDHGIAWHTLKNHDNRLGGMAHGATGIALALCQWNRVDAREEWRTLVEGAYVFEQSLFDERTGAWADMRRETPAMTCFWCYGAPGIGLAFDGMRDVLGNPACDRVLETAVDATWQRGLVDSHCLCHGNLGNAETFAAAYMRDHACRLAEAALGDFLETGSWKCGLPAGATTPGLMCGLAGIGYGLLRHVNPNLPRLLLLEGPAACD